MKKLLLPPKFIIDKAEWKAAKMGRGTDCTIRVGNQSFLVHKLKLMLNSEYFNELLTNNKGISEIKCETIRELQNVDPRIIKIVIKFMYLKAIGNKTQKEIRENKLDLLTIVKIGHQLGIRSLVEWSTCLLDFQIKNASISKEAYKDWFILACQTGSSLLFEKILGQHAYSNKEKLLNAINFASMNALITQENW